ncbi:MAG: hypothetical protein U0270_05685 [Labilithrix sp.]
MRALLVALTFVVALLTTSNAGAVATPAPAAPTGVTVVKTGMYLNQIHEMNLKENFFVVDLYVWFRWKGDAKPNESFSFIDGRIDSKTETGNRTLPDGSNYFSYRVVVKITKYWDVRKYPLDRYQLDISLEEDKEDVTVIRYEADEENSAIAPSVQMPGYVLTFLGTKAGTGHYRSNFGDTTLPKDHESDYSRITTSITMGREGNTYFAKLFFALWIAAAIAFLCFFIKPTNVDPRFGLGVGAIFAAIASEYTVSSGLPEIGAATLADKLHVVAYAAIFVTLAQSTYSLWLFEHGREDASKRIDRRFALGLPALYVIANILVIAMSVTSAR